MFYLYIKTHNISGLKYLGYTKNDPMKYKGSGVYWKRHIHQYGYDVTTEILFQSESIDDISKEGQKYSKMWNVVNDKSFANLCEEDGNKLFGNANINFRGHPQTVETRKKISDNNGRGLLGKYGNTHPSYGHKVPSQVFKNVNSMIDKNRRDGPWNKGKIGVQSHSDDTKKRMSESASKKPKAIVTCPICGKSGGRPAMTRFHFDKCRGYSCV
jgi:hypothetical protein